MAEAGPQPHFRESRSKAKILYALGQHVPRPKEVSHTSGTFSLLLPFLFLSVLQFSEEAETVGGC